MEAFLQQAAQVDHGQSHHAYLTTGETADLMRTKPATLAYWRHRGEGPPFARVGKRVLYRRADVLAWLEAQFAGGGR